MHYKYAQDLLESSADVRAVQELLGHAKLSTTQVYLTVTDKRIREAVALLDNHQKPQTQPFRHSLEDLKYAKGIAEENTKKAK